MFIKFNRLISFGLSVVLILSCFICVASAADAKAVLTFKVSDDGYAIVADCKESAQGVISVPTSVSINKKTYKVKYIGNNAFDKCKLLTEVKIPEGVTVIGYYAFRNCTKLKDIYIPESLIRCEFDAFDGCAELTIHCYMSTYQFVNLSGTNTSITYDIIDAPEVDPDSNDSEDALADLGIVGKFINALKALINRILEYFGANDEDFSVEDLPFELPFEIPEENDNPFIDLL